MPRFARPGNSRGKHRATVSGPPRVTHHTRQPSRLRPLLALIPITGAVSILIGSVAMGATPGHDPGRAHQRAAAEVTVTALQVGPAQPVTGQAVRASATVVAARTLTFDDVVLAVRDRAGHNRDFPLTRDWTLGTTPKLYTSTRTFKAAGTYTYWFAYRQGGTWTDVSPRKTFTVSATGDTPTPTPTPTPAPTTSPAPTPTPSGPPSSSPPPSSPPPSSPPPSTGDPAPVGVSGTWRYTFGDDFTGPVGWGSKWADSSSAEADGGHGNPGNQQLEWNQAANCSTSGGILSMTARPDDITSPSGKHYDWSSCLLTTSPSYAFRYGYIEIRAELPSPKGFWPAFWTWQAAGNNQWTETDVYEFYSDNHSRLYLSQHSGAGGGSVYAPPFDPTTGFHTYGADIEAGGTRFYVDGKLVYTAPGTSTGMTNIILDNFVYSKIPPASGTTASMRVDYVRAWQH